MGQKTKIEWTGSTWTPVRARNTKTGKTGWHCVHKSEACRNCYAESLNIVYGTGLPYKPGHLSNGDVELFLDEKMLLAPLRWKKPRKVFPDSMTDMFADFVTDDWIDSQFAIMALSPRHTYQPLTKRPDRMAVYLSAPDVGKRVWARANEIADDSERLYLAALAAAGGDWGGATPWPLPNVWLGTSAGDQPEADENIERLIAAPAAKRFVSFEPLLGPINATRWLDRTAAGRFHAEPILDWVIAGGESGRGARPVHPDWIRSLRDQCQASWVPFFFKQWGEWLSFDHRSPCITVSDGNVRVRTDGRTFKGASVHSWTMPDDHRLTAVSARVGKKGAGATLDGRIHQEFPT